MPFTNDFPFFHVGDSEIIMRPAVRSVCSFGRAMGTYISVGEKWIRMKVEHTG